MTQTAKTEEIKDPKDLLIRKAKEKGMEAIREPGLFVKFLERQAWFPQFGPYNVLLIMEKAPRARCVYPEQEVKALHLEPQNEDDWILLLKQEEPDPKGVHYEIEKFMDEQRLGFPLQPAPDRNRDPQDLSQKLIDACGLPTEQAPELPPGVKGLYYDNSRRILLLHEVLEDPEEMFRRVAVETALSLFSQKVDTYQRSQLAFPACCCAYLCCRACGVSTGELRVSWIPFETRQENEAKQLFNLISDAWPKLYGMLF